MPHNYEDNLLNDICSVFKPNSQNPKDMEKVFKYCQIKNLIMKEGNYKFGLNFYEIDKNGKMFGFFNGYTYF